MVRHAVSGVKAHEQAEILERTARAHEKHTKMIAGINSALASGTLKGEPLTAENRKRLKEMLHHETTQLGYIERSADATKARRYHGQPVSKGLSGVTVALWDDRAGG